MFLVRKVQRFRFAAEDLSRGAKLWWRGILKKITIRVPKLAVVRIRITIASGWISGGTDPYGEDSQESFHTGLQKQLHNDR
jgi:hypothetical protein